MGILDMIIAHYNTYADMDILEWYRETAKKVLIDDLDGEELEEYTLKTEADIVFEQKMFFSMSDILQSWYEELRERVD